MRSLLAAALFLLGLNCEAQLSPYNLKFTVSRKDFVDTVNIEYLNGQIILPVSMNGQHYRFLFDTGASQTTLFDDVPVGGTAPAGYIVSHDAIANSDTVHKVYLPPMTIGSLTLTGCQATVQHRIANSRQTIDGIIGFDIVCKGINVKIDVRNGWLILSDRFDFFEKEQGVSVKYKLNFHVPYIGVCPFGKYTEQVLFDTGSRQLYMMNRQSFETGRLKAKINVETQVEGRAVGRHSIGHSGVEQRGEVVFLALDSLLLGDFAFHNVHTLTTVGGSHVGTKLLEYGTVSFNPKRNKLRFSPYDGGKRVVVANKQLEKAVVPVGGRAVIGLVREDSDVFKAGFREGDVIMRIDQKAIGSFAEYLQFRPIINQPHTFLLRDADGRLKEVRSVWQ